MGRQGWYCRWKKMGKVFRSLNRGKSWGKLGAKIMGELLSGSRGLEVGKVGAVWGF